jgi:ketosteroid isomerase-like protein
VALWGAAARAASGREATLHFANELSAAFDAGDVRRLGSLFAERAELSWVDEPAQVSDRPAIEKSLARVRKQLTDARLFVGRVWVSTPASVLELVLTGTRAAGTFGGRPTGARKVGLAGALVVVFDKRGLVQTARLYADWVTYVGQVEPSALPQDMVVRRPMTSPPNGVAVLEALGTASELKNLGVANATWDNLTAHRPADVMTSATDDYLYEDYAAPKALGKGDTQRMVTDFLTLLPDFEISAKPTQMAAGAEVVTEVAERGTFRGKPVTLHALDVKRFRKGQIIREWQYSDYAAVLRQLTDVKFEAILEP